MLRRLLFLFALLAPALSPALEVRVSPALPLSQALQQVREARKAGDLSPATIVLPEGATELLQPVILEAQDSNLTITGTKSMLIGAPKVTGWEKHEGQIIKADVSKLLPKGFRPRQLLCDGERQILARYPNFNANDPLYGGWAFVAPFPPAGAPEGHLWKRTLYVKPEDVRTWAHPEDVELDIFAQYGWWNFIEPVASLDPQTRLLTLKKDCGYDLHPHNRYHFQNALEELDAQGEWFYDKHNGMLYFWPPAGKDMPEIRLPVLESFFKVKPGAKDIVIRGLTLTGCSGSAITFERAEDCLVEKCVITKVGDFHGSGIGVSDGKNVRISRCEISFTGSNGISMSGGDRKTLTGPGHVAEDCHIHHMGVFNKNACGVALYGVDNTVRHCHIHDGPRMGVQMSGNNLVVEYNHLHHLCLETQDGGAIYTGGRDWISSRGSKWRYNMIHDIIGCGQESAGLKHPWFTFGLYPDDNTGGLDIIGNIVFRVAHTPIHMHNSRDCIVENNIFALGGKFQFDLHGWSKTHRFFTNHLESMIKGYESVAGLPAWKGMRGMDLHPKDAVRDDGTVMSGDIVRYNIMFSDTPGVKYGDVRSASPKWNTIDYNLAWNGGHPIVTGINEVGPDKQGPPLLNEPFNSAEPGKTPKGWGFNHRPNKDVQLVAADGALRVDCALGTDPGNPKSVFHGPDIPIKPGAAYRVKLRIKSTEPTAKLSLAFASFKNGEGYWQAGSNSITATNEWQEFEATGRMLRENETGWKPWMKAFWLRIDCHEPKGQVFIDDVRITEAEPLDEWAAWQNADWDQHSIVADPMFVDWKHDDFRLKPESPAFKLGFKAIPVEKIGIRKE
ncbi:right-handed parallel beta-helix repeat-containing protein [Prosthecobacter sp.]|uniref:right-handed parallel beta-helix repeat-containing protein n=1 Tax=Prosthecobacter sp. TaxID=1965333 RepID=UPI001D4083E7|nr:right-handed parallel beta-helix repeat-containing protein [Prosthecobacter sp.]MCB1279306.1 right-handed parallel beta-helix repeat-containing protein [Prosthecobacter sp.]